MPMLLLTRPYSCGGRSFCRTLLSAVTYTFGVSVALLYFCFYSYYCVCVEVALAVLFCFFSHCTVYVEVDQLVALCWVLPYLVSHVHRVYWWRWYVMPFLKRQCPCGSSSFCHTLMSAAPPLSRIYSGCIGGAIILALFPLGSVHVILVRQANSAPNQEHYSK